MQQLYFLARRATLLPLLVALGVLLHGCQCQDPCDPTCKDYDPNICNPSTDSMTFAEVIAAGGNVPMVSESETVESQGPNTDSVSNGVRWRCETETYSITDGNPDFFLFNPNAEIIYPGNLLQGGTLDQASPDVIVVKRAGGTISYDLANSNLTPFFEVDEIKLSTVREAMNNIIASTPDPLPADFSFSYEEVQSEKQMAFSMGVSVSNLFASVDGDFSFSRDRSYSRYLVKLNQRYYTMSFDLPTSPAELFHPSVMPGDLAPYVGPGNPATYISSVTYGRIFYMLIEATETSAAMDAAINLAFEGVANSDSANVEASHLDELSNLKIKVIAFGGDAKGTFDLIGETNLNSIVDKMGESSGIENGVPLSYVVRNVQNNQVVNVKLATEYDVKTCTALGSSEIPPLYRPLANLFEDGIGAMVNLAETNILIFNRAGTEYTWYNGTLPRVSGLTYSIKDPQAPLGRLDLDHIGAAIRFAPNTLYLFDTTGFQLQKFDYQSSAYAGNDPPNGPMGTLRPGIFSTNTEFAGSPFKDEGIGAMCPTTGADPQYFQVFSKSGRTYAEYVKGNGGRWLGECDLVNDTSGPCNLNSPDANSPLPAQLLQRIGAGTTLYFPNEQDFLYINTEGNLMVERNDGSGPWVIAY